ncbi:hypothetical protein FJT64_016517 [Amphibalanus amphitrite]|uniref:Uncharacterized protein n=2 Tax=Amphibalanus amphitrite TaxID=1232801 RepID=A0A6A4XEK7_AMPAM|nr:hypothetical protein FJT64_016517 [Amphibalanus amphitrite]
MSKPMVDCDNPDMAVMKRVCSGWFAKVNSKWSLDATSRSRGSPHTIGDDLCQLLKTGTFTFGAFYTYCGEDKPMYTGSEREDATLCCKDGATC